jgi:hypothetical protein
MARNKTKFGKITTIYLSAHLKSMLIKIGVKNLSAYIENLIIKDLNKQGEELINNLT